MEKINASAIIKKVNAERQSVNAYSDEKIPAKAWNDILDTIMYAPSSHGFEPYWVLIISKDNPLRQELLPIMYDQPVCTQAEKLIFFISLKRKVFYSQEYISERTRRWMSELLNRKGPELDEAVARSVETIQKLHFDLQEPNDDWAMKQAYIALGMAMYSASLHGIGTTPLEGFSQPLIEELFKKHQLMTDDEHVAVALAFGYPKDKKSYWHQGTGKRLRDPKSKKFKTI